MPDTNGNKYLTILIYVLLSVITLLSGWNSVSLTGFKDTIPKEYVRLERYVCDVNILRDQIRSDMVDLKKEMSEISKQLNHIVWKRHVGE